MYICTHMHGCIYGLVEVSPIYIVPLDLAIIKHAVH